MIEVNDSEKLNPVMFTDGDVVHDVSITSICKTLDPFQKFHVGAFVCYKQLFLGKYDELWSTLPRSASIT